MPQYLLAIITPKLDRLSRVEELAKEAVAYVQQNEPDTLKYQWFRAGTPEAPKIVVWEAYADQAAFDKHMASSMMARFVKAEEKEQSFAAPPEVLPLESWVGFASQDGIKV